MEKMLLCFIGNKKQMLQMDNVEFTWFPDLKSVGQDIFDSIR